MAQQTEHVTNGHASAVEWLFETMAKTPMTDWYNVLEQAKAMEKEQTVKAFSDGQETPINNPTLPHYSRDEYYNDTYNK